MIEGQIERGDIYLQAMSLRVLRVKMILVSGERKKPKPKPRPK